MGGGGKISSTLKGVVSVPHIPFVKGDFVTPQQFPKSVLKRPCVRAGVNGATDGKVQIVRTVPNGA